MSDLIPPTEKNPNPQGKGCVPLLQDWQHLQPHLPAAKSAPTLLRDYCLSALVLAARFHFRPVQGRNYYLYCADGRWSLSLISSSEWGNSAPGEFVAECVLRTDMTWDLNFAKLHPDTDAAAQLQAFVDGFAATLAGADDLAEQLPFYVSQLPYYQRMLATGLSVSLNHSITQLSPAELKRSLPALLGATPANILAAQSPKLS